MLIYDIEIVKAIPLKNKPRVDGVEYCDGWTDHANMGISVIGAYDYVEERARVFMEDNLEEFRHLAASRLMVSFNGINFDNKVIRECWGIEIPNNFDLLQEIWKSAGLGPRFNPKTHGGYGLDKCCEKNFATRKTGSGALAPVLWQQKRYAEVIDYCLNDVYLTKQLNDLILNTGLMKDPKTSGHLTIRHPQWQT